MPTRRRRARPRIRLEPLENRLAPSAAAPDLPYFQPATHQLAPAAGFLTGPSTGDPYRRAMTYLRAHARQLGLRAQDFDRPHVTDRYTDADTGVTHIYLRQTWHGLDVVNAVLSVNVAPNGAVMNVNSSFVPLGSATAARAATRSSVIPTMDAVSALAAVARPLGLNLTAAPEVLAAGPRSGDAFAAPIHLSAPELSADVIPAQEVYVARPGGGLTRAWEFVLRAGNGSYWYDVAADAGTGALVQGNNWADADASYNVFPYPGASPDGGPRTVVTDGPDPVASPFGWHDTNGVAGPEFTDTRGNNVFAQEDADADNAGGSRPDGGANLAFDAPIDFSQDPTTYTDAATINLFYWVNVVHDIQAKYGFDEAAGNFQVTNYSGHGSGGDPVLADSQDGADTNNANFATPPDGLRPRLQMYLFDGIGEHTLTVDAGTGLPAGFTTGTAAFGPQSFNLSADLVQAQPPLADAPLTNAAAVAGKIALIDRGGPSFVQKALNAQAAGAVGVVIVNNVAGAGPIDMATATGADSVTIPLLSVSKEDGDLIKAALAGGTVHLTMFRAAAARRDSSLDATIIAHEYGHGVSNRLTGGPANANALTATQSRGMGEGWSDFYALMVTQLPTDEANDPIGVGTYVSGEPRSGKGVRRQPYSLDMSVDPITFDAYNSDSAKEVHKTGEIWASALWDLNWLLIAKYGYDPDLSTGYTGTGPGAAGNKLALRLVNDALKLQPANPSFTEARDAILLADRFLTGGANQAEIWQAFARRGLGVGASTTDSSANSVTLSFAVPTDAPVVTTTETAITRGQTIDIAFDRAMDRATFSRSDIVAFTDANSTDRTSSIKGFAWADGGRTLRLTVAASLPVGTYTLRLGPNIASQAGPLLNQDNDATPGEAADDIATVHVTRFNTLTVTTVRDGQGSFDPATLSLREAIALAGLHPGDDTITFAPGLKGPIFLNSALGPLTFSDPSAAVTVAGPASELMTIDGQNGTRLVRVAGQANVTLERIELTRGNAATGAGILNDGTLTLTDCVVSSSASSDGNGGGALNNGRLTLVNTTFRDNTGIGLANYGILSAANSTFVGNRSPAAGGAIFNSKASTTLVNCTLVGNTAASTGGGGIYSTDDRSVVTLNNTIVAGNFRFGPGTPDDITLDTGATLNTAESFNNLIGTGGAGGLANGMNGNQVGVADAKLGPLTLNRGLIPTVRLLPGSPALDAGRNASVPAGPVTDQRGFTRIVNGTVDIGAFEEQSTGVVTASLSKAGVLTLTGDAAGNGVSIKLNEANVGTTVTGLGTTKVRLNGVVQAAATLTPHVASLVAKMGGGNDTLAIHETADFVLDGAANFGMATGPSLVQLVTTGKLSIGGPLTVTAAAGPDAVSIQGNATSVLAAGASFKLGNGGSTTTIDTVAVHGKSGLALTAGTGDDALALKGSAVDEGPVKVTSGGGNAKVVLDRNAGFAPSKAAGLLSVSAAGAVDVTLGGPSLGGLSVRGGAPQVSVTAATQVAGAVTVAAGTSGNAHLSLASDFAVGGAVRLTAGKETDLTQDHGNLTVDGDLVISAGTAARIDVASTSGTAARVKGSVRVTGGSQGDHVTAGSGLNVDGDLTLNLKGGDNQVGLGTAGQPLTIGGNLTITSLGEADSTTLTGVRVSKNAQLKLGAGADRVTVTDGTQIVGATLIDLAAGDDLIDLATAVGAADPVSLGGPARFTLGTGNDTARIGLSAGSGGNAFTQVAFAVGNNLLDLGTGTNEFNLASTFVSGPAGALSVFEAGQQIATLP